MIDFDAVTVTYAGSSQPVLRDFTLTVEEGELCLVAGRTGAGKSTVLGAINGLVPHFTGGRLAGRVTVAGLDTRTAPPRELAHLVGVVGQDPLAGFVTDTIEDELAYTMEQLAVPPAVRGARPAPITIYRALDFLREQGLVHRIESRNAFIACVHNHDSGDPVVFLICETCGTVGEAGS
ncbi:MAG TPA: ATP-binding cassette domain-containing protein, partial [Mycobacteriales bacterium]|nr:ATP-binding cassette domain-containing protein [Mycobacteriales bacterium]